MGAKHINNRSLCENVIDNYMKLCPLFKHYNAQKIAYSSVVSKVKGSKHLLLIKPNPNNGRLDTRDHNHQPPGML